MDEPTDICLGAPAEPLAHQHTHPGALVHHLASFIGHRSAPQLVTAYGIDRINQALQELPTDGSLSSPAGWITWRCRQLAEEAPAIPTNAAIRRTIRLAHERQAHDTTTKAAAEHRAARHRARSSPNRSSQ